MRRWRKKTPGVAPKVPQQNPKPADAGAEGGTPVAPNSDELLRIVADHRTRNELDEADRLVADGVSTFPNDRRVLDEYTVLALLRRKWDEAYRRCQLAIQALPEVAHYHAQLGWVLHFAGNADEADRVLADANRRFPDDIEVARDFARLALLRGELSTSLARWEDVRSRFPRRPEGYIFGTQPLIELGRFQEAEALLDLCRGRFYDSYDFLHQSASIATRQRNWEEAFRRLEVLLTRFPDAEAGQIAMRQAVASWQLDRAEGHPDAVAAQLPAIIARKAGADHEYPATAAPPGASQ